MNAIAARRRPWPALALSLAASLGSLASCAGTPRVGGAPASERPTAEVLAEARRLLERGEAEEAVRLAEWLLRRRFDDPMSLEVRRLAVEARLAAGDDREALVHLRRLLDEHPIEGRTAWAEETLWDLGRRLVRERSRWFGDFAAGHDAGLEALQLLVVRFPQGERADDAWKELGLAFERDGRLRAAIDVFERLAAEHPDSEWADLALFRAAEDYLALSAGERFDVEPLLLAEAAYRRYLARFPDGNHVREAREALGRVRERIAAHEWEVAAYYRERGDEEGERIRLANLARSFPDTEAGRRAAARLARLGLDADRIRGSAERLRPLRVRPPWRTGPEAGGEGSEGAP